MADGIRIEIDDAAVVAALGRLAKATADLSPAMADIASAVLGTTQRRFETESGPGGIKWVPFSPKTLKSMRASRRANPHLLRDRVSPGLYSSQVAHSDATSAEVGTNLVYGPIHQLGGTVKLPEREGSAVFQTVKQGAFTTKDGRRVGSRLRFAKASTRAKSRQEKSFTIRAHEVTIPARPYLGIDDADRAEILAIIEDHIAAASPEVTR
ncbi:MAG: hypothetical protein B7Y12_02165 [Rhizobiales bacterium 24-66-13]|jgi:phage virion morphogenesis protein|nr:MAG: hypothetical protein B7Y61_01195 [Rhizobiales bacterium 35-66-30]OYZ82820.1 MAG: hypothetical protein B7Y12_02165 [Rhizobiales bacterium 24-66-13]OZB11853.1 MAG: hypothetical protein B7X67_02145 [Rhizobiales bacterium 39-66-18]HQS08722.1 phage virion morphogenesis protein [Xanthobacteraceae bacterium]HQS45923.1 phage virion morphogenesis protein [Xanthobacteraceae bacterium]